MKVPNGNFPLPPFKGIDNVAGAGAKIPAKAPVGVADDVAGAASAAKPSAWSRGKDWAKNNKGTLATVGGVVAAAGLFTGLTFLPEAMVDAAANALFSWLPEEQRKGACSLCSSCSCCSSVLLVVGLVVFIVMGQTGS